MSNVIQFPVVARPVMTGDLSPLLVEQCRQEARRVLYAVMKTAQDGLDGTMDENAAIDRLAAIFDLTHTTGV